jgi:hypothetical protein
VVEIVVVVVVVAIVLAEGWEAVAEQTVLMVVEWCGKQKYDKAE